jgi:CheY-like chemotaxis protein
MIKEENFRILVVDDDVEDHLILQDYFSEADLDLSVGFRENGRQAIQFLENISEDSNLPDLIILDLNMPIMNGTQTLINLKGIPRLRHIPIIIFSTSENETEKRKCLSLGAVDYMVKPHSLEECRATIRRFSSFITV